MTIEFRDVHASYDATIPILRGVDFTVNDGEFVAFVGTNGAGKSTTMRLVNGLLKPDAGEVLIDGIPTTQLKTSELARRVGFLFQNPDSQICCNTVRDELLFGFRALKMDMDHAERRVDEIVAEFGFNPDDDPFLLNRGTRQLLALASIVVLETPVIVLDEPTTGLDFRECVKVLGLIRRLHEQGTTVVMVCHDMEVVADFAERVIVMHDGLVVDQGPTFEVLRNRRTLEAANLVPPQIVDISLGLSIMQPGLADTLIGSANTLNEMEAAVASAVGKGDHVTARPTYAPTAPGAEDAAGIVAPATTPAMFEGGAR
ncbi:MAG: ABC transporter ATP-binding protein [Eggerthellaceae bacterium]|nr:ABC transporter ATP-binding protein [Eggerthellaceae bacterium]